MALYLISCKKDGDDDGGKTRLQLITSAAWKFDNAYFDQNKDNQPDFELPDGTLEDCDTDNIVTLNADGTGIVDEGATKCDGADPQTYNITWEFKVGEKTINIPGAGIGALSGDAEIVELTGTKLRLSKAITDPLPGNVIVDLKH